VRSITIRGADARHLIYVDYYAAMTDGALGIRSNLTPDGVHPSQAGYRVMDPLAQAAIRAVQLQRTHPR
jgi:lysophospholipase L1-like esterase